MDIEIHSLPCKAEMIRNSFRNSLWKTCDATLKLGRAPAVRFHSRHDEEDWTVTLADTGAESGTAHRIKLVQKYLAREKTFLLTYGDGVANIDINESIRCHENAGKMCTLTAVHPAGRYGALSLDEAGRIHTFSEKPQVEEAYISGGFMVCDYKIFGYLERRPEVMFEREPIADLVRDGELNSYRHEGFWQSMDTYQEAQYLNGLWETGTAPWKVWFTRTPAKTWPASSTFKAKK